MRLNTFLIFALLSLSSIFKDAYARRFHTRQKSTCGFPIDHNSRTGHCPKLTYSTNCIWCYDQCRSDLECPQNKKCCIQSGCGNQCLNAEHTKIKHTKPSYIRYPNNDLKKEKLQKDLKNNIIELTAKFKLISAAESPDGVAKEIITVNDQFPGPTIRAKIGDTIVIRVHNRLRDSRGKLHETSVHYHGIEMKLEPWMDGPERVTQCPIPYGQHMDYTFTFHQSGSYWYHSHHEWQYIDGFWGWLIVDNIQNDISSYSYGNAATLKDVHPYDDELLISLSDWYWKTGETLTREHDMSKEAGSPNPDSSLINGKGMATCSNATAARHVCDNNVASRVVVLNVIPGFTYRVRLLNPSAKANFNFSIDSHEMRVIEVDGVDTTLGRPVDVITLWPAQRYSVLVKMLPHTGITNHNYWIRADMIANGEAIGRKEPHAVLHYLTEKSPPPDCRPMQHSELQNLLHKLKSKRKASVGGGKQGRPCANTVPWSDERVMTTMTSKPTEGRAMLMTATDKGETYTKINCLRVSSKRKHNPILLDQEWCDPVFVLPNGTHSIEEAPMNIGQTVVLNATIPGLDWLVNNRPYTTKNQTVPAIFKVMGRQPVSTEFRPQYTRLGQTVQIIINNLNPVQHPYHLHGHTYYVMGTGKADDGPFNENNPAHQRVLRGVPVRRDTTHTLGNSWSVVRIITNNPGVWILHCHIHWHLDKGLAAVFIEGEQQQRERYRIPTEARRVCKLSGINLP